MKQTGLLISIIILICWGCEDRNRLNPLDPENELTQGAPTGIKIHIRADSVELFWSPFRVDNMKEYLIYRGFSENELIQHGTVTNDSTVFRESNLAFGQSYYYAVQALTEFSHSVISEAVATIPGPHTLWVADMYNFFLRNISYDGSWNQKTIEFTSPRSLALDSKTNIIWLGEYFKEQLLGFDHNMNIVSQIELPSRPIDFAVDSLKQRIFVVLEDSSLQCFNMDGSTIWKYELNFDPNLSSEIAYDAVTENIWLSSNIINAVIKINAGDPEKIEIFSAIPNPGPLETDPFKGGVWVATESGIAYINSLSELIFYKTDLFIYDVSVHPQTGNCYYTGSESDNSNWETGYITESNPENFKIILGNEMQDLYNIQVIPGPYSSGIFVQQAFTWKLLRFNANGDKIGELSNFNSRLDFVLD